MIRYDLYSNTASSDLGLQHHPALQELVENLRLAGLESRFTRVQQREEGEMNLASAKFGGGVKVKSATVKLVPPETSLPGLLAWVRTVLTRVDRGLHLEVERVRQTNGAGLAIGRLLAQGRSVFLSGFDAANWARITAVPDFAGQRIPEALVSQPAAQGEYLMRRQRPGSFYPMLKPLVALGFLPAELRDLIARLLSLRDNSKLQDLSEPQVINLGLISDGLERYQKLLDQFYVMLITAEASGELPLLFELLVQEIPFATVRQRLLPFVLENRTDQARDNRLLVNELRIALRQADAAKRQDFQDALTTLVVGSRLIRDPALYLKAARLAPRGPEEIDALAAPRRMYLAFTAAVSAVPRGDLQNPAPAPIKQALFELVVQLTYQAQYNHTFREGNIPGGVAIARELLSILVFETFNIASLKSLNSNLPPKGVAKGLSDKTPVKWEEVVNVREPLEQVLYPLAAVGAQLAEAIHGKYKDADQQKKTTDLSLYLKSGISLLGFTNYVLGRSGLNPLMWEAALEAGRTLGLTVLESRDQMHVPTKEALDAGEQLILGHVVLMNQDDRKPFPLRARPELILLAYRYLYLVRVAKVVRRFMAHKLLYLHERYGSRLFEVIYQHVVWSQNLRLSRRQLGEMVIEGRVLERERLRDFGYQIEGMPKAGDNENPWLKFRTVTPPDDAPHPFAGDTVEQAFRLAYNDFLQLVQDHATAAPPTRPGMPTSCRLWLNRLAEKEHVYHLDHPAARSMLAASAEAVALTEIVDQWVGANKETILAAKERREAILVDLPGPLGFLSVLKDVFSVAAEEKPIAVRLIPAWEQLPEDLDPVSKSFYDTVRPMLDGAGGSPGARLRSAIGSLQSHRTAWGNLQHVSSVVFIDQALRETLLRLIVPAPPLAKDLIKLPEGQVLCLGASSFDQGKFNRLVARPDRRDVFATLSEMSSRLMRLQRMRDEFNFFRDLIADIQFIIGNFNVSYETAYMQVYSRSLTKLDQALSVPPENLDKGDLEQIEICAKEVSVRLNEIYEQERTLGLRDRWLNRALIRLRQLRPNARINFVDQLFEGPAVDPALRKADGSESNEPAADAKGSEFQTFTVRVRNVIAFREWMAPKTVVVLSPTNTQQRLTMHLIDQLYRMKGVNLPILVNIAGCESFVDALLTRIPPHRLFNLNDL